MELSRGPKPKGTPEELQNFALELNEHGCCAPSSGAGEFTSPDGAKLKAKSGVKGCPWWEVCQFDAIKNRKPIPPELQKKGEPTVLLGPENVIFDVVLPNGASDTKCMPCYDYYWSGLWKRYDHQTGTGERIAFRGYAPTINEKILVRGSRKKHRTRDNACEGCMRGSCVLYESFEEERPAERFKRLYQIMPEGGHTKERLDRMKDEAETTRLRRQSGLPSRPLEPEPTIVKKGTQPAQVQDRG
jgi:hypothetical protein